MSKAFTRETDGEEEDITLPPLPAGSKNYITPQGYAVLRAELFELIDNERPRIVEIVHWAASNGDRSENGDYLYGKKRLREIDRRIRFLTKRLEIAEVTDPSVHHGKDQVFFGATVRYCDEAGHETTVTIRGIDETEVAREIDVGVARVIAAVVESWFVRAGGHGAGCGEDQCGGESRQPDPESDAAGCHEMPSPPC